MTKTKVAPFYLGHGDIAQGGGFGGVTPEKFSQLMGKSAF